MKKTILVCSLALLLGSTTAATTSYAFGLPDMGSVLGGSSSSGTTVNVDGLTNRQSNMLTKMQTANLLFASATSDVYTALELDPSIVSEQELIVNNLTEDRTNEGYIKNAASANVHTKEIKEALKNAQANGDQERLEKIDGAIRNSEMKKTAARIFVVLAVKDAVDVIKEGTMGLRGASNVDQLKSLIQSAQGAQKLCDAQNKQIKDMDEALKEYKKTRNITPPSQEEATSFGESWQKQ